MVKRSKSKATFDPEAFLAKAGKKVLVLEKTGALGGRCRSVELMGHRFDIGADYFGKKILDTFAELGKKSEVRPVWFKVVSNSGGKTITTIAAHAAYTGR